MSDKLDTADTVKDIRHVYQTKQSSVNSKIDSFNSIICILNVEQEKLIGLQCKSDWPQTQTKRIMRN